MGHPFGPKWPIFLFYPKGLPTTCLMQIYHLGLNCRVSKNGPPFWAKVAHFFFYPKGLPTSCLMQIYHLGLNCRVSKNGPPYWAKVTHFPFLPRGPPNIMSDTDLPFGVKLQVRVRVRVLSSARKACVVDLSELACSRH